MQAKNIRNFFLVAPVVVLAVGCNPTSSPDQKSKTSTAGSGDHGHSHATGDGHDHGHDHTHGTAPHGGTIADWGGGKYHVEFTVDHEKQEAAIYVLGSDAKSANPISAQDGKLLLTIKEPAFQVELTAQPLDGESDGKASRYVGKHEKLGVVQEFAGTISGEIDGTPYAGDFKEEPHEHK